MARINNEPTVAQAQPAVRRMSEANSNEAVRKRLEMQNRAMAKSHALLQERVNQLESERQQMCKENLLLRQELIRLRHRQHDILDSQYAEIHCQLQAIDQTVASAFGIENPLSLMNQEQQQQQQQQLGLEFVTIRQKENLIRNVIPEETEEDLRMAGGEEEGESMEMVQENNEDEIETEAQRPENHEEAVAFARPAFQSVSRPSSSETEQSEVPSKDQNLRITARQKRKLRPSPNEAGLRLPADDFVFIPLGPDQSKRKTRSRKIDEKTVGDDSAKKAVTSDVSDNAENTNESTNEPSREDAGEAVDEQADRSDVPSNVLPNNDTQTTGANADTGPENVAVDASAKILVDAALSSRPVRGRRTRKPAKPTFSPKQNVMAVVRSPLKNKTNIVLESVSPSKTKDKADSEVSADLPRRRSRAPPVSYALPSLRSKLRRPTEKLVDAIVEKENVVDTTDQPTTRKRRRV